MTTKLHYETPVLAEVGSFEALTHGQSVGVKFDGNFVIGQPVPFGPGGKALILS